VHYCFFSDSVDAILLRTHVIPDLAGVRIASTATRESPSSNMDTTRDYLNPLTQLYKLELKYLKELLITDKLPPPRFLLDPSAYSCILRCASRSRWSRAHRRRRRCLYSSP
jgi:hypothetical protein